MTPNIDDIEIYFQKDGGCFIESLIRSRLMLSKLPESQGLGMIKKIDYVIEEELELALMSVQKAKSEIIKSSKNNLRPVK